MALDSKLTQTITVRSNGDQLLRPLQAMGNELNRLVQKMQSVANPSTAKGRQELQQLTMKANQAVGTMKTLYDLMENGSRSGRARNNLLAGLSDQAMGKKVMSASKLRTELSQTTKASEALEVRLAQLYKGFEQLGNAGKAIRRNDINKALNTQEALQQVKRLEREIDRLNGRNSVLKTTSPELLAMRTSIGGKQSSLLERIQNGRRVDWSKEIADISLAVEAYNKLSRAEASSATSAAQAAARRRAAIMDTINMNEAQLRASVNRGAGGFSFTKEQARGFNIPALNTQINEGIDRLQRYQLAMSKAVEQGRAAPVLDRLAQGFGNVSRQVSEATAKVKAYESLPEQKIKSLTSALFSDGGLAFGARIAGASLITTGVFSAINAVQNGLGYIVQLQDAFAKLQAISGATDTQMQKFSTTLVEMSTNSRYSTLEIVQGATQIAQAGYAAQDAATVLDASLKLAAGSGSTVTEAVDSMTSALGAFNLQASEAGHTADVFMEGLNRSKLSISQMQAALQYAGATAHESGMSFEELTAAAASMANAGVKSGSTIGTGLRMLIVGLQKPTKELQQSLKSLGLTMADIDIRTHGLAGVVKTLTDAGFSAQQAYDGLEVRAASAFLAFRSQIDVYDELSTQLTKSGAAAEAAAKAQNSVSAEWQESKNKLTALATALSGPFTNAVKGVLELLNGLIGFLTDFVGAITQAVGGVQNFSIILAGLAPILGVVFGPAYGIAAGVVALFSLAGAAGTASDKLDKLAAASDEAQQKMTAQRQTLSSVDDAINRLIERQTELKNNHVQLQVETLNLSEKFEGLSTVLGGAAKSYDDLLSAMLRYRGEAMRGLQESARGQGIAAENQAGPLAHQMYLGNTGFIDLIKSNAGLNADGSLRWNDPALKKALDFSRRSSGTKYEDMGMSNEQLVNDRIQLEAIVHDMEAEKHTDGVYKQYYDQLKQNLNTLQQIAGVHAQYQTALSQFNVARAANSPQEQQRFQTFTEVQSGVQQGLSANEAKQGSGDNILAQNMAIAKSQVSKMEARLKQIDANSAEAKVLMDDISRLKGEIAKVQSASDKATADLLKNEKAGPGEDLQGSAVAALIKAQFEGANVYSYKKRPYSEQVKAWNKYKAGKGPLAARPGTSLHGDGHALDMTPIPGMDIDQVTRFLESRGVEVIESLNEKDPTTGRYHWHFGWKPKKSHYQENYDRELQDLLNETAGNQTSTASKKIEAIIQSAKGGFGDYSPDAINHALANYKSAAMNQFDVSHPTAGLDALQLKKRAEDRAAEAEKVQAQIQLYVAQYYKGIGDKASKDAEAAFKESERILKEALDAAHQASKDIQHQIDTAGNRYNRYNNGVGTAYILGRRKENADISGQQAEITARRQQILRDQLAASKWQADINAMPDGAEKDAQLEKVAEKWEKIREELQQVRDLQDDLNAKTQKFTELPLKERLEGSAQAWLENSGAMDSWSKQAEDAVGPTLDALTQGMTDMFQSIMDGSKSVKQALGDFLRSFAEFVLGMIAKALALLVVKKLLQLAGVDMPASSYGGGNVGKINVTPPSQTGYWQSYDGGPVPGRYGGGSIDDLLRRAGGSVRKGFTTHDSSLYNLAHGEYVVRNKSVREIGLDGMDMINKHGRAGLAKLAGANVMQNIQMPRQETNVYVVKPDSAPSMGPNDVLVTINEDILQGGTTKKLIKQVAQGAI